MPPAESHNNSPTYGTWIRMRAVVIFGVLLGGSLALLAAVVATPFAWLALLPAAAFGWIFLVIILAWWRFSDSGGRYQAKVHDLIRARAKGDRVLDIGCGNGHLAIGLAKESDGRQVVGLDYWGTAWEYSQQACEQNARLEGVAGLVRFVHGSAAALPFDDGVFDCVVSCLTFHEVRELADKTVSLSEAMRVLKRGGTFALLDLFSDPGPYPRQDLVRERIEGAGGVELVDSPLSDLMPLPFPLGGKRLLKYARLITGTKGQLE